MELVFYDVVLFTILQICHGAEYSLVLPCTQKQCEHVSTFSEAKGGNLTLHVDITFGFATFASLNMYYSDVKGKTKQNEIKLSQPGVSKDIMDTRLNVTTEKKTQGGVAGWRVTLVLKPLVLPDNGREFSIEYFNLTSQKQVVLKWKVQVTAPPEIMEGVKNEYKVREGDNATIMIKVLANPVPVVRACIGEKCHVVPHLSVSSLLQTYYSFSHQLRNVQRSQCGEKIVFEVSPNPLGMKRLTSSLMVMFTPETPANIAATLNHQNCLTVSWNAIESGNCNTTYTLKKNEDVLINDIKGLKFKKCGYTNTTINDTVSVLATVNGLSSPFSDSVDITKSLSTMLKSSVPLWAIILIAVSGTVVLVVIVITIVCCCKMAGCPSAKEKDDESSSVLVNKDGDTFDILFQNTHYSPVKLIGKNVNGDETIVQEIESNKEYCVRGIPMTHSFIARDINENILLYFTDGSDKRDVIYKAQKFGVQKNETCKVTIMNKTPSSTSSEEEPA